jgi:hypothetical protein
LHTVKLSSLISAPVRRSALGLILVAVVLFPGGAAASRGKPCRHAACSSSGSVRWMRSLTGSWLADNGDEGTMYAHGQAYAAAGSGIAAVGFGLTLDAYDEATGFPRWAATLSGVPVGSAIMSVRVWPGVVTVGVEAQTSGTSSKAAGAAGLAGVPDSGATESGGSTVREEFVLNAVTGKQIRVYPAAWLGGAVSANLKRTVIMGTNEVTSYDNATGKVIWRVPTVTADQAWQVSHEDLYVTVSAGGQLGTAPVTALRQIDMRNGGDRLILPVSSPFDGRLSGALGSSLLFSSSGGLSLYSRATGRQTGFRAGAVPEFVDPVQHVLYVDVRGALIGVNPVTGRDERGTSYPGPPGTYGVRGGVALGLDPGAHGAAWGYNVAKKHVIWTSRSLPWPHFFVDLSGLGGSADPASDMVLLATCAKIGGPAASAGALVGGSGQICLRPMLVAIQR